VSDSAHDVSAKEASVRLKDRFRAGETFAELLERPKKNSPLWDALYKRAAVPILIRERADKLRRKWHLLVISEDWCGDSLNTLPVVARLTDAVSSIDMRIIGRDANPDLMNAHLTGGKSKSIPAIMVLDEDYIEHGWWGPRPGPLQEWVTLHGLAQPKDERYREIRAWYARDHGVAALTELLDIIESDEKAETGAEATR
jgi:Thioredoxin